MTAVWKSSRSLVSVLSACAAVMAALATARAQQIHPSFFGELRWRSIGPPRSGYVSAPAGVPGAAQGPRGGGPGVAGRAAGAAGARVAGVAETGERGVYRSTDGGRAWTRVLPVDGSSGASDVYLDYGDPQIVYAMLGGNVGG